MNINLELYRIFYMVAKTGNITKASKVLLISQPAVSKSIKNLENMLGGTLFVRTKRGVTLTEEGHVFYNYIEQMMELINNAENKFTDLINLETGSIRIGVSQTLTREFLLPYLEEFHRIYPKINIQISTSVVDESMIKLKNGLLDLIILHLPVKPVSDIDIIECKKIQDCFIVNHHYIELTKRKIKLEELNNYPLILQSNESSTRKFIEDFCSKNNVVLKPNMNLGSYTLVVEFTKIGLGIGYANKEYIKNYLEEGKLYELDIEPKIPTRSIGVAISKKNIPSFSAKKLIEIILGTKKI
jgi:DNA-binding transcriptional LysR family regulator